MLKDNPFGHILALKLKDGRYAVMDVDCKRTTRISVGEQKINTYLRLPKLASRADTPFIFLLRD